MKIAFVYDVVYPWVKGGVEKRIHELAERLAVRGHDVHIIGMKYWEGPDTMTQGGVTLHGICPARPLYVGGRRSIRQALWFGALLVPFLVREDFDLIDCQQFPFFSCFSVSLATVLKKEHCAITWHEVWDESWYDYLGWPGFFGRVTERLVARLPYPRIAVSATTAGKLRLLGIRQEPCIVPNGIDTGRIQTIPPAHNTSDIIFTGRLIREKHIDLLVRAFFRLLQECPERAMIILGEGPERGSLEALIRNLGITDRVQIIPFVESHDAVIGLMKASHVFVIPSTREGFGIAALEALGCGLPVVTVDHPDNAVRELITEQTGFLSSLSENDLSATIRVALANYPSMKTACRAIAETHDWETMVDRLEREYRRIVPG